MENILVKGVKGMDIADASLDDKPHPSATASCRHKPAILPIYRKTDYGEEYNMDHKYRGKAFIFNHEHFTSLDERKGTNIDRDNLKSCFKGLGFDVKVHNDLTHIELMTIIRNVAAEDHTDRDCLAIIILTHGGKDLLYAKDHGYTLQTIANYFDGTNCASLIGKPKLFFIQACRGHTKDSGIAVCGMQMDDFPGSTFKIPTNADFLYAFSTTDGNVAWRNPGNGSWFINVLVDELNANGKKQDLLRILTIVTKIVATKYETYSISYNGRKQLPSFTSTLLRTVRFNEK